ncbi:MAG: Septum formation initiator [candidate division WWE3 bacterium GW2011_GWF2_41_45]|uniref:Septum formation initiator n=3 Tax=Katanobacteria TaxID=422282 RepID=A0A1F4VZ32_UNCKA|nr:MAG: Septum formation initiator [candidate division WWE3 bacterium GW2011_GWC2_41_23]KKS10404.1 MAG: Septum formation initiator [candidate division WWE3 bacterium GW2011_GWF2_41_45]KKS12032.1 MAG: Septum formation initiator [candidate division WWE3 bacterium GW2011_GWF1_41_53]KKS20054.1 MAG: Septum formation initiator [candidate division WWE3 bacterium GW2011_GWE1_41_72]KKS26605.1 MAG: Septum formation initiator [candidate division WWE3 bacterium GW2011_GWC1_42_102]KKS28866.1 MAG: Septum fo
MLKKGTRGKLLVSLALLVISANFIKSTVEVLNSRKRLEDALDKEVSLTFERDTLKKRIEYKKTGEYIEESARNELNMIKPGEKVFVLDEEKPAAGEVASASETRELTPVDDMEDPNWYLWYKLFF